MAVLHQLPRSLLADPVRRSRHENARDTVGVGTVAGTTVDVEGYHLFTGLDEATLKTISQTTGGTYHPASNASELDGIASSINLRLTVTNQPLPLAGAFIAFALALLVAGAVLTVARTGRVV